MWVILEKWLGRFSTLAAYVVVARLLGPAKVSQIVWVLFFAALAGMLTESGISTLIINESKRSRALQDACVRATWIIAMILVAGCLGVGWIYWESGRRNEAVAIWVCAIGHVAISHNAVWYAVLARELRYRDLTVRRLVSQVIGASAAVSVAAFGGGPIAISAQYVAAAGMSSLLFIGMRRSGRLSVPIFAGERQTVTEVLRRGLGVLGVSFIPFLTQQAFLIALPLLLAAQVAGQVILAITLFGVALDLVISTVGTSYWTILARFERSAAEGHMIERAMHQGSTLIWAATGFGIGLMLALFPIALGEDWQIAGDIALYCVASLPMLGWIQMARSELLSQGKVRTEFSISALGQVSMILPVVAVSSRALLPAVGVAFLLRAFVMLVARLFIQSRAFPRLKSNMSSAGHACVASGALFLTCLVLDLFHSRKVDVISGILLCLICLGALAKTGALAAFHALTVRGETMV